MHREPRRFDMHFLTLILLVLALTSYESFAQSSTWKSDWEPGDDDIYYVASTQSPEQGLLSFGCGKIDMGTIMWTPKPNGVYVTHGELADLYYRVDDAAPKRIKAASIHLNGDQVFVFFQREAMDLDFIELWSFLIAAPPKYIEFRSKAGHASTFSLDGSHEAVMDVLSNCAENR